MSAEHRDVNKKSKVLCVTDYYLPGYKGGGPIRTLANMSAALANELEFLVFTRDRDLGSSVRYDGVQNGVWQILGAAKVYYAEPKDFGASGLLQATQDLSFDLIYLNSFFSWRGSISILLKKNSGCFAGKKILIAPRGEFSPGALQQKFLKKKVFLTLAKLFGLYKDVYWHASTKLEAEDIMRALGSVQEKIFVASDLVTLPKSPLSAQVPAEPTDDLRLVFISRITPKKNLTRLLKILAKARTKLILTIYGPIEDEAYWSECQTLLNAMPSAVRVSYGGELHSSAVSKVFSEHDLFVFPTLGENFGHVVYESLCAGTPVLLSDQTPWTHQADGSITVLPLDHDDDWLRALASAASQSQSAKLCARQAAHNFAQRYFKESKDVAANLAMFKAFAA